ncbi:MAG: hypothetical protein WCR30_03485 [Clostridia bacterium]
MFPFSQDLLLLLAVAGFNTSDGTAATNILSTNTLLLLLLFSINRDSDRDFDRDFVQGNFPIRQRGCPCSRTFI